MPEIDEVPTRQVLADLHSAAGARGRQEIKLKDIEEEHYFEFLSRLGRCHGLLIAIATDSGISTIADLERSRENQARSILANENKMKFEAGRQALRSLSEKVRHLAPQLYVQLKCQVILMNEVVRLGSLYFVQRLPSELGRFAWRVDQKNSNRTEYERAFQTLTPAWIQTMSLRNPMIRLEDADYAAFNRFDYPVDQVPTYPKDTYGIDIGRTDVMNIGKLIHEDFQFVDSAANYGVQIADLLASGLRRCLRQRFGNSRRAAHLLGKLMLQGERNNPPVRLLRFSKDEPEVNHRVARLVGIMAVSARAMVC